MKIKLFNDDNDNVNDNNNEQPNIQILKEIDDTGRDIKVYSYKNIVLTGLSHHYPDVLLYQINGGSHKKNKLPLILPIKEMTMSLNKKSYYEENDMIFTKKCNIMTDKINVIITMDVFFFIYNTENYYHFIYDTLPYLYSYFQLKKTNPQLKLLINYNKNKSQLLQFVCESLLILGIKDEDIIIHSPNNIYSNVYISTSLTHNGMSNEPPRREIFEIYDMMINSVISNNNIISSSNIISNKIYTQNMKNIYISRRTWVNNNKKGQANIGTNYTTRRRLMNEDELVNKLNEYKFTEFFSENYTMSEKIQIFYNADIIMGAIGGTIANCVFCNREKCKIVTLVSPDFMRLNNRMKYLFDGKSVFMFEDCYLDCKKGEIAQNVRIEIINKNNTNYKRIGEIVNCIKNNETNEKKYLVRLFNNLIGLNKNDTFEELIITRNEFKTLDNGINSPWYVDIDKLIDYLV